MDVEDIWKIANVFEKLAIRVSKSGNNNTGEKILDRLGQDPRIVNIWSEGENDYWAEIAPEYIHWDGRGTLHKETAEDLIRSADEIVKKKEFNGI